MHCTVLSRRWERLDWKCTVRNRFRKSWAANVLYCTEQMQGEAVFLGEKENSWSRLSNIRAVCFS
jgi:hypothetical protein